MKQGTLQVNSAKVQDSLITQYGWIGFQKPYWKAFRCIVRLPYILRFGQTLDKTPLMYPYTMHPTMYGTKVQYYTVPLTPPFMIFCKKCSMPNPV